MEEHFSAFSKRLSNYGFLCTSSSDSLKRLGSLSLFGLVRLIAALCALQFESHCVSRTCCTGRTYKKVVCAKKMSFCQFYFKTFCRCVSSASLSSLCPSLLAALLVLFSFNHINSTENEAFCGGWIPAATV